MAYEASEISTMREAFGRALRANVKTMTPKAITIAIRTRTANDFMLHKSANRAQTLAMNPIILILLVILLFGGIGLYPGWGWHNYGWAPTGGIGLILVIILIVLLLR
jgi:hypothetical protein